MLIITTSQRVAHPIPSLIVIVIVNLGLFLHPTLVNALQMFRRLAHITDSQSS